MPILKSFKELFVFGMLKFVVFLCKITSKNHIEAIGSRLGLLYFYLCPSRRKIAINNLKYAYPSLNRDEIRLLALNTFKSFAINYFEGLKIPSMSKDNLKSMVEIAPEDMELFSNIVSSKKGVVTLSCHYGNLFAMLTGAAAYGLKLSSIVDTSNRFLNAWLTKNASRFGLNLIIRGESNYIDIFKVLNSSGAVNFFTDMDWCFKNPVFINFFGRRAASARGPARILYHKDYIPVIIYITRNASFKYTLHINPFTIDKSIHNREEYIKFHIQALSSYFEALIKHDPVNWTWQHPRWRTQ